MTPRAVRECHIVEFPHRGRVLSNHVTLRMHELQALGNMRNVGNEPDALDRRDVPSLVVQQAAQAAALHVLGHNPERVLARADTNQPHHLSTHEKTPLVQHIHSCVKGRR